MLVLAPSAVQFLRPARANGRIFTERPVQASSKGVNASLTEAEVPIGPPAGTSVLMKWLRFLPTSSATCTAGKSVDARRSFAR